MTEAVPYKIDEGWIKPTSPQTATAITALKTADAMATTALSTREGDPDVRESPLRGAASLTVEPAVTSEPADEKSVKPTIEADRLPDFPALANEFRADKDFTVWRDLSHRGDKALRRKLFGGGADVRSTGG
jgi:hypothetical protein